MNPKKTFIDAGVLIAAARGRNEVAAQAMKILDDPGREFVASRFLKLEVLPKAVYEKRKDEVKFYEAFFDTVTYWANSEDIARGAYSEACKFGLSAMDALHVAAAKAGGAEDLVTTERPEKPICRIDSINVISIRPIKNSK